MAGQGEVTEDRDQTVQVQPSKTDFLIFITHPGAPTYQIYRSSALQIRASLRHSSLLLQILQRLWHLINPYHLKTLSRKVFSQLLDLCTRHILVIDPSISSNFISIDLDIDYGGKKGLVFCEFHDSMFELLDNTAKSRLVTEYILLVRKLCQKIEEENPFPTLDFHNKLHETDEPRRMYYPWMRETIARRGRSQANSPHFSDLQVVFESSPFPSTNPAFERLSRRQTHIPHDPPLLKTAFRMVEMLTRSQPTSPKRGNLRSPSSGEGRNLVRSRRNMSRRRLGRTGYLLQMSPLSTVFRAGRPGTSVLESVLRERQRLPGTLKSSSLAIST